MRTDEGGGSGSGAGGGEQRPAPSPALTGAEAARWYCILVALSFLARQLGLSAGGGKAPAAARIAAALGGRPVPTVPPAR